MIKVVIADDEQASIDILKTICGEMDETVQVVGTARKISQAISTVQETEPDILLLDIEFPEGSGFEVLQGTLNRSFELVFISAHRDYAIQAFKHYAFDYILKPIEPEAVQDSINRAIAKIRTDDRIKSSIDQVLQHFQNQSSGRLGVPVRKGIKYLNHDHIVFVKADGSYSKIKLLDGQEMLVSKKIGWIHDRLPTLSFARIHKSHIVNKKHVTELCKSDGGYVITTTGDHLTLSRNIDYESL